MTRIIFYVLVLSSTSAIFAQTKAITNKNIALEYMDAYGNWDFDKMNTFYSDDVHFEDPTGSEAFNQNYNFTGKDQVFNFFKNIFKDGFENSKPSYVNFKIDKVFESGSFVIINSTFECLIPNTWFKKSGSEKIFISIPFLTILEIQGSKIISHKDYGDYNTYTKQIEAQLSIGNK